MIITDLTKLRNKCDIVSEDEASAIIAELERELEEANKYELRGIGLAAPQIGINKRAAIVRIGNMKLDLINCSIAEKYDLHTSQEGCLSVPNKTYFVDRYNEIIVKDNMLGNKNNFVACGVVSVCVQHEMEHWDGILIMDKSIPERINIGDNMDCPCGSKKKYKKCCKKKGERI